MREETISTYLEICEDEATYLTLSKEGEIVIDTFLRFLQKPIQDALEEQTITAQDVASPLAVLLYTLYDTSLLEDTSDA